MVYNKINDFAVCCWNEINDFWEKQHADLWKESEKGGSLSK